MNDEQLAARFGHRSHKVAHKVVALHPVNPNAVLDRHRDTYRIAHGFHTISHQLRLGHQTSAKRTALHPLRGATTVEVDFAIAPTLAQLGSLR